MPWSSGKDFLNINPFLLSLGFDATSILLKRLLILISSAEKALDDIKKTKKNLSDF